MSIAQEIEAALIEVGQDLKGSAFMVSFTRATGATPWAPAGDGPQGEVPAFDRGNKRIMPRGSTTEMSMRMLLLPATGSYVPKIGDSTTLDGREFKIESVEPLSPVGESLMYKVGLID